MTFILDFVKALISNFEKVQAFCIAIALYFLAYPQFKFQTTLQRRMAVIEEAYEKIKLANMAHKNLVAPFRPAGTSPEEEKRNEFIDKANEMVHFLEIKRIFFSTEEKKHIDAITSLQWSSWWDYQQRKLMETDREPTQRSKSVDMWDKNWKDASDEMPKLIDTLEQTFKKALNLN